MSSRSAAYRPPPPPPPMAIAHNRRALHLPVSSLPYSPPPPAEPPYSFFPSFPAPPPSPPPPLPLQPTVPANISFGHPAPRAREAFSKVAAVILLPLLALALLATATFAFLVYRRRRSRRRRHFSGPHPSFRAASKSPFTSTADSATNNASVNARATAAPVEDRPVPSEDMLGGCGKLDSPEIRPLPPLPRHFQYGDGEAEETGSSEEEFFSPRGSLIEKESSGRSSSSRRTISAAAAEECGSRSSSRSTPPYPSSNLDSSPRSSPVTSSPRVRSSSGHYSCKSEKGFAGSLEFLAPTPATQLPPPPPLPPSPPNRKPTTPSPPSSPMETESNSKADVSEITRENLRSRHITDDFPQQLSGISTLPAPPQQNQDPPPPPPPPPPPIGYWKSQSRKPQAKQPLLDVPSKPYLASAGSIDPTENSKAAEKNAEISLPKLKPLHWDKVQASSNRAMVWDQLKSSSFHVDEEMIETLFVSNATSAPPKETNNPQALPLPTQENWVLHPKKAQNISILLRALNVTKEEVCEALLEGYTDSLGTELLETLLKMSPTKEEEHKLKEHKNSAFKLGPAENFLKALIDIPFVFKRVDVLLYISNFNSEINFLMKSFETLEAACEELRSSRLFLKLLDAVLKTGNRMNVGTFRGDAHAFKLDTLLKLVDVKGNDGKTTVLHFVVQEITRTEGSRLSATCNTAAEAPLNNTPRHDLECRKLGLQIVAGLEGELSNVKKAAAFNSDILSGYVSNLVGGMDKINEVLKLNEELGSENSNRKFHDAITRFLKSAEDDINRVQAQESVASSLVKEITEYFHGNSAREETHPLRIFMVVRDFLLILAQVCKDVGRITEQATISLGRKLPAPVNPAFVPIFPRFHAVRYQSSDDESSVSSWCDT